MKKILSLILICFVSISTFFACGKDDKTIKDVQTKINKEIKTDFNQHFTDEKNPYTITVKYSTKTDEKGNSLNSEVSNENLVGATENQLRYMALDKIYQQLINYMFNYYEKWNESLVKQDVSAKDSTALYKLAKKYESAVKEFTQAKSEFESSVLIMGDIQLAPTFEITKYSYAYNNLIDSIIAFESKFIELQKKYVTYSTVFSQENIERMIDETYFNIACFVYYENVKVFEYNVGDNGICDLSALMREFAEGANKYVKLSYIQDDIKELSSTIIANLQSNDESLGAKAMSQINNFIYTTNVYNQRFAVYMSAYKDIDMFGLSSYRFKTIANANIDSFVSRFNVTEKAQYDLLCEFSDSVFVDYIENFSNLI